MDRQFPADQRVSYHAVTRYVQRMLGVTVDMPDGTTSKRIAQEHCTAAGTTIHQVRVILIPPTVLDTILSGFTDFRYGGIEYFVSAEGIIATIYPAPDRPAQRMKILTDKENRRENARHQRRRQRVSRAKREFAGEAE